MEIYKVVDPVFGTTYSRELFSNKLHCEDGPAVVYTHGGTEWYQHGQLHRMDGPAIDGVDGQQEWYQYGKRHRVDGPATKKLDGSEIWFNQGVVHRENGPAFIDAAGNEQWFFHGDWHRLDGPAIKWHGVEDWVLFGESYSKQDYNRIMKNLNHHFEGKDMEDFPIEVLNEMVKTFIP